MQMKNFNKDFVQRTKSIVTDLCNGEFEYDVTLLLNCLLGLVSLPTEKTPSNDTSFQSDCIQKLNSMGVLIHTTSEQKTFRTIKNALSHMYIEPENSGEVIKYLILKDKENRHSQTFHTEMKFTVLQLREFALFVADKHLARLK